MLQYNTNGELMHGLKCINNHQLLVELYGCIPFQADYNTNSTTVAVKISM